MSKLKCEQCKTVTNKLINYHTCYSVTKLCSVCKEFMLYMESVENHKIDAYKNKGKYYE